MAKTVQFRKEQLLPGLSAFLTNQTGRQFVHECSDGPR